MKNLVFKVLLTGLFSFTAPMLVFAETDTSTKSLLVVHTSNSSPDDEDGCCERWCRRNLGNDQNGNPVFLIYCCKPCAQT